MKVKDLLVEQKRYHFVGTCVDSFEDGCTFRNYVDVNDFAVGEESATEISWSAFSRAVKVPYYLRLGRDPKFLYDEDHDVYIAYDQDKDIHYFWVK